ncbi:hypothetical protein LOC67_11295 [Stieleria sp. JC731]|uniref:tetratricopeptide repeat protein n=1 Tax=Pirellulaceae TaxID=2691357 RepID=UPI001E4889FA|nr:hypothetical protein [Stieleria sp. JC731]MCC9601133.1 hypothetical protein [Stieleria sp. JC731]
MWNSYFVPEVDRAHDTLRQVADPWLTINNSNSRVIQWRLLFPLIGNLLHLRDWQFLCLPLLGCFLTLAYFANTMLHRGAEKLTVLLATTLFAMLPWYFVSTGWLAYFDSWLVLGLLITTFDQRLWLIAIACIATPWVDERFTLALPMVLAVRAIERQPTQEGGESIMRTLVLIASTGAIYPIIRIASLTFGADNVAGAYTTEHTSAIRQIPAAVFLSGLWQGYRIVWIFAAVFLIQRRQSAPRTLWWITLATTLLTSLAALLIAGDMHRSLEMLTPIVAAGILGVQRFDQKKRVGLLSACLLLSIILPASHRLWFENYPISRLTSELRRQPPTNAEIINMGMARASQMLDQGDAAGATLIAAELIERSEEPYSALLFRANLFAALEKYDLAIADLDHAIELDPVMPDGHFAKAMLLVKTKRFAEAISELQRAIELGGPAWPGYRDCQAAIEVLQQR